MLVLLKSESDRFIPLSIEVGLETELDSKPLVKFDRKYSITSGILSGLKKSLDSPLVQCFILSSEITNWPLSSSSLM